MQTRFQFGTLKIQAYAYKGIGICLSIVSIMEAIAINVAIK